MKFFLILVTSIAVSAFGLLAAKPNIVLIYIDDLGYGDLGCYGCKDIPTPNIDRLAKEGVCFTASYITNPPCCPSRCSLMMGQYAQRFGKYGMSRCLPIPEDRPTLAKFLSGNGYVTGHIGKWDLGSKNKGHCKWDSLKLPKIRQKKPTPRKNSLGNLQKFANYAPRNTSVSMKLARRFG